MKKIFVVALTAGLISGISGVALAQQGSETPSPGTYAPGSADAPIHGSHDKGAAVREDNGNGMQSGRSSSDGAMSAPGPAMTGPGPNARDDSTK
jgi:hypothetical protein